MLLKQEQKFGFVYFALYRGKWRNNFSKAKNA